MNQNNPDKKRDLLWDAVIIITALSALVLNFIGLILGITIVLPHLLYIPVAAAAYRYPKWGLWISGAIGGSYLLMVIGVTGSSFQTVIEAMVRTLVVVLIGWLVAFLTLKLRERENLYQSLFDHSENGTLLIRMTGPEPIILEANWKASELIGQSISNLRASPLSGFWDPEACRNFILLLQDTGAVYAAEETFRTPGEKNVVVLVSAARLPEGRAILTFIDISSRVQAEKALAAANDKLSFLSRISIDHLHRSIDTIIETIDAEEVVCSESQGKGFCERLRTLAWNVTRQLFLAESYKDLGAVSPAWLPVQEILESVPVPRSAGPVSVRSWTARLEIYADPLFATVLEHILGNALRHGKTTKNLVVTYHETGNGLDLVIADDGIGIPTERKQAIFEYDAGGHAGMGLFICRQIVAVTGMTLSENGTEGNGARFVIHIPGEGYRIEGSRENAPPLGPPAAGARGVLHPTGIIVRELRSSEFSLAESLWIDYHGTKGDPATDRIFAVFLEGQAVSVGRCRHHPDGFEVDGIFTPVEFRGHGYANAVTAALVESCGSDLLYMHAVRDLTGFYRHFGFEPIDESVLPPTIRERYAWAGGEMEGANVCPMKRNLGPPLPAP
jgi:PAS domain S-box-containing protein